MVNEVAILGGVVAVVKGKGGGGLMSGKKKGINSIIDN